jgi:hypothetical protein
LDRAGGLVHRQHLRLDTEHAQPELRRRGLGRSADNTADQPDGYPANTGAYGRMPFRDQLEQFKASPSATQFFERLPIFSLADRARRFPEDDQLMIGKSGFRLKPSRTSVRRKRSADTRPRFS